jgi:hypothetical protein
LSAPHDNEFNPSLNDLISKEEFSLQYVSIDDAIKIIKRMGNGARLIKTDITDAFKIMPLSPDMWPYHCIKREEKYYFFNRLVFGSRSSPKIFDNLSRAVCWIAENNFHIQHILHLLDDFLVIVPLDEDGNLVMDTFLGIFESLGIPLSQKKMVGPVTVLEYLGIVLDSVKMEARLPKDKIARIQEILENFSKRSSCTKRELLSLLGHLNFACRVIHPGRSFISYLIKLSTTVSKLSHHVSLKSCRSDLQMWLLFLKNWNGVSFFLNDHTTVAAGLELYTDATESAFGGYFNKCWFQGYFPQEILKDEQISMAFLELYPIVMACVLWGHQWSRLRIVLYCDNMSTVDIINKGRSKVLSIMKLMRKLTYHSALNNYVIYAKHIPGINNSIADAISRFQMTKFRTMAPEAVLMPTPCLPASMLMMS